MYFTLFPITLSFVISAWTPHPAMYGSYLCEIVDMLFSVEFCDRVGFVAVSHLWLSLLSTRLLLISFSHAQRAGPHLVSFFTMTLQNKRWCNWDYRSNCMEPKTCIEHFWVMRRSGSHGLYPLVDRLIWSVLTLPISVPTTEHSFSFSNDWTLL